MKHLSTPLPAPGSEGEGPASTSGRLADLLDRLWAERLFLKIARSREWLTPFVGRGRQAGLLRTVPLALPFH